MAKIRALKGKSVLELKRDYTCIDIETTGLDAQNDEIIQIAAQKVRGGKKGATFCTLVRPSDPNAISPFIEALTGITPEMVKNAPVPAQALEQVLDFIGGDAIVGYNVNFDINFLYDSALKNGFPAISNDFVDVLRLVRRVFAGMESYTLDKVAKKLGVETKIHHRADADVETTINVFEYLVQYVTENDCESLLKEKRYVRADFTKKISAKDITPQVDEFDVDNPLYGKVVVFTGALKSMTRKEAMQAVADAGGVNANTVVQKTNYLVLGNNDDVKSAKGGKSSKQKKAEELILKGNDLKIISENVFLDMLDQ